MAVRTVPAEYINNGDVIFLDASSTVAHIIPYLKKFKDIIVITNSPKTSMCLGEENIKNYCAGGLLLAHSIAYVGNETEKQLSDGAKELSAAQKEVNAAKKELDKARKKEAKESRFSGKSKREVCKRIFV